MTTIALLVAQISLLKPYFRISYLIGALAFYPFFFVIGAISDLNSLSQVPISFVLMPIIVVSFHALTLGVFLFFRRKMLNEAALASQALIGGVGTAVAIVQAKGWKHMMPYAIAIGVFGYAIGNYIAIAVYHITKFLITYGY